MQENIPAPLSDPAARMKELCEELDRHNRLYHELDAPEITDEAYDALSANSSSWSNAIRN